MHQTVSEVLTSLGELASHTGATERALVYFEHAVASARRGDWPFEQAQAEYALALHHQRSGDFAVAATCLRTAIAMFQRLGSAEADAAMERLASLGLSPGGRGRGG